MPLLPLPPLLLLPPAAGLSARRLFGCKLSGSACAGSVRGRVSWRCLLSLSHLHVLASLDKKEGVGPSHSNMPAPSFMPCCSHKLNCVPVSAQVKEGEGRGGQPGLQHVMQAQPVSDQLPTQHGEGGSLAALCMLRCACCAVLVGQSMLGKLPHELGCAAVLGCAARCTDAVS